jgi:hypothetical protein
MQAWQPLSGFIAKKGIRPERFRIPVRPAVSGRAVFFSEKCIIVTFQCLPGCLPGIIPDKIICQFVNAKVQLAAGSDTPLPSLG